MNWYIIFFLGQPLHGAASELRFKQEILVWFALYDFVINSVKHM